MAGDWIKFDVTTPDKPEVVKMAAELGIDQDAVVGKLLRVWAWADQNTVTCNGESNGVTVTSSFLDRLTFCRGFANAMRDAGWLSGEDGALRFPNFARHNGKTAKERAVSNRRVAKYRAGNAVCNGDDGDEVTLAPLQKPLPEKRREEEDQKHSSSAAPTDGGNELAERLAQVSRDAVVAYNASRLTKRNGGHLPNVSETVGREKRQQQVRRCLRVAREICRESTGTPLVTPEFWAAYFDLAAEDDFYAGRVRGGNGHENFVPDFETLTTEKTMLRLYDRQAAA